jgi:hypothetical protein
VRERFGEHHAFVVAPGLDFDEFLGEREVAELAEDTDGLALRVDAQAGRALVLGADPEGFTIRTTDGI